MLEKIENLIKKTNDETGGCSISVVIKKNKSYKELVAMGDIVVEPIMQKICNDDDDANMWMFWLLEKIVENKPIIPDHCFGDFYKLSNIWKNWYLESKYNKNKNKQNDW